MQGYLNEFANAYPIGGEVLTNVVGNQAEITFKWNKRGSGEILMLALPHHIDILQKSMHSQILYGDKGFR